MMSARLYSTLVDRCLAAYLCLCHLMRWPCDFMCSSIFFVFVLRFWGCWGVLLATWWERGDEDPSWWNLAVEDYMLCGLRRASFC
jgi:hypothetical protein